MFINSFFCLFVFFRCCTYIQHCLHPQDVLLEQKKLHEDTGVGWNASQIITTYLPRLINMRMFLWDGIYMKENASLLQIWHVISRLASSGGGPDNDDVRSFITRLYHVTDLWSGSDCATSLNSCMNLKGSIQWDFEMMRFRGNCC